MTAARKTFEARVTHGGKRIRVQVGVPRLVGVTRAAEMLSVPKSNITRLREQGRLEAVEVEGPSAPVFLAVEVEELAAELKTQREARQHRADAAAA